LTAAIKTAYLLHHIELIETIIVGFMS